ncbi:MAG TPA: hypothetical protein VGD65_13190 [Chryseosolibacter sp.]
MKNKTSTKFEQWVSDSPKLTVGSITVPPHAFKGKMEEGERILKVAGLPKRPKK